MEEPLAHARGSDSWPLADARGPGYWHTLLLDFNFDLPRLGSFLFEQGDAEYTVAVGSVDVIGVEGVGYGETAHEVAVATLDAMVALDGVLLFELALAGDREGLVFDADVDVFEFDIRQVGFEDEFVLGLVDIDGGRPRPVGLRF